MTAELPPASNVAPEAPDVQALVQAPVVAVAAGPVPEALTSVFSGLLRKPKFSAVLAVLDLVRKLGMLHAVFDADADGVVSASDLVTIAKA